MGYRNYIGFLPKKEYNKIKSLTVDEVCAYKGEEYVSVYKFGNELYEFGKYVDFKPPKGSVKTFFKKKDTEKNWNGDGELKVITKEFLAYIISTYDERVTKYYNDMVTPFIDGEYKKGKFLNSVKTEHSYPNNKYTFDFSKITESEQTALFNILEHMRSFRSEWVDLKPYNLEKGIEITTSWKYEYGIFELVKIYKSFDWKKNVMYYYGY